MAGTDVLLTVGIARTASYQTIDTDIQALQKHIESKKLKINVGLNTAVKTAWSQQIKSILDGVNQNGFSVKIQNITVGAGAISSFRRQLESIVNTISLDRGVSITLNAKDIGEIKHEFDTAGESAEEAARKVAEFKVQMEALNTQKKSLYSALNKLGTGETDEERARIAAIIRQYEVWAQKVETVRATKVAAAREARTALEAEREAILQNIGAVENERAARDEAVAAMDSLLAKQQEVQSVLGQFGTTEFAAAHKQEIDEINSLYASLEERVRTLQNASNAASASELANLRAEFEALLQKINLLREEAAAKEDAAGSETARNNLMRQAIRLLTTMQHAESTWTKAQNGHSKLEYASIHTYILELQALQQRFINGKIGAEEFRNELGRIQTSFDRSANVIKSFGENTQSAFKRIGSLSEKFTTWFSITRVIMYAVRAIRQMVQASIELDSAFANLKIVTGATDEEMNRFVSTAVELAKSLGQSVSSVTKSIETFSRLGYNLPDAAKLAEFATIMANVAAVDIDEATTGITSIIKGYSLDVDNAEHVADVLIQVGQKFAVSASEMMEAYEKAGAALNATNTSFEKSAGLIAAANASVQNASVVGTALKTVSARIRGSKADLEELGEDVDDLAEGFSKYAEEIKALTGFDIMVEGTTDQFKDLYDIFEGISAVWDRLSDTQQARVAEILGGTRQLQVISSVIGNWSDAVDAYTTAMNSAGAATEANSIYMETAAAHINQFKASFQEFSTNLFSSSTVSTIVDIGNGLVKLLNLLEKAHLLLPLIVASIVLIKAHKIATIAAESAARVAVLTANIVAQKGATDQLAAAVASLSLSEKEHLATSLQSALAAKGLTSEEITQQLIALGLADANGVLISSNVGLKKSFESVKVSMPIWGKLSLVITGIITLISWLKPLLDNAFKSLDEKIKETNASIKELQDTANSAFSNFRNLKTSADEIIPRFAELAQGVDKLGNNVNLTDEEYAEFLDLNNRIAEMFPELNLGMDSNGNAMLALSFAADTLSQSLWDLVEAERAAANTEIANKFPEMLESITTQVSNYQGKISELENTPFNIWGSGLETAVNPDEIRKYLDMLDSRSGKITVMEHPFWGIGGNSYLGANEHILEVLDYYGIPYAEQGAGGTFLLDDRARYAVDVSKLTDEQVETFRAVLTGTADGVDKEIAEYRQRIAASWNSIAPYVAAWMKTDELYNTFDATSQKLAVAILNALDFNDLANQGINTVGAIQEYVKNNIITPINEATPEVKAAFTGLLDLADQFSRGKITADELGKQIRDIFTTAFESLDEQGQKQLINWMHLLGFDGKTVDTVIDSIVDSATAGLTNIANTTSNVYETMADTIDAVQDKLSKLSTAMSNLQSGKLGVSDVIDLLQQFPELAPYVDLTADNFGNLDEGLRKIHSRTVRELVDQLQKFKLTNGLVGQAADNIDNLCDSLLSMPIDSTERIADEFGKLASQISASNKELTDLEAHLKEDDYDSNYVKRVEYFARLQEVIASGRVGSREYNSLLDYFGLNGESLDAVQDWISRFNSYFAEGTSGLSVFLSMIQQLNKNGLLDTDIASWDGSAFYYDYNRLPELAEALGLDENVVNDFIQAVRAYSSDWEQGVDDIRQELIDAHLLAYDESTEGYIGSLSELASYLGMTEDEVAELIKRINETGDAVVSLYDDRLLKQWEGFEDPWVHTAAEIGVVDSLLSQLGITMDDIADGEQFDNVLAPLLRDIGWTQDEIDDLRAKMYAPFDIKITAESSIDDVVSQFEDLEIPLKVSAPLFFDIDGETPGYEITQETITAMVERGFSNARIAEILQAAASVGISVPTDLDINGKTVDEVLEEATEDGAIDVSVHMSMNDEDIVVAMTTTTNALRELIGEDWIFVLQGDATDVEEKVDATTKLLDNIDDKDVTVSINNGPYQTLTNNLNNVLDLLDQIKRNSNQRVTVTYQMGIPGHATGTKRAAAGPALLGDEYSPDGSPKPELVVSDGQAYLAGVNGPTVGYLKEGDVVYSAKQTKRILSNTKFSGGIPAFSTGGNVYFGNGNTGGQYNGGNYTGGNPSNNTSSSNSKEESEFDKAYKYHQHLLAMERESMAEYLVWLEAAYQHAYASGQIDLEEFYKYEEEVYKGRKDLFEDYLNDIEHKIEMMEHKRAQNRNIDQIIAYYRQMMDAVYQEAERARAAGLTDDDEYIQELQKKWWEYHDAIADARSEWFEDLLNDEKFAIEQMNNVGVDSNKIVAAWQSIMSDVQSELRWYLANGYKMTDEVMQDLLEELWNAGEEIISIANDVVDGIQNVYTTFTDAAKEWATTGYLSVDSFQAILALGPKYLQFLYDENGQLKVNEKTLQAVLAARTEELAVDTALTYVKRILTAVENSDIQTLVALTQANSDASGSTWGLVYATLAMAKAIGTANGIEDKYFDDALTYINRIQSLSKTAISTIASYYDTLNEGYVSQSDALDKLIDYTKELIKWENEQQIKALQDELAAYKEIIEAKKKSLQLSKEQDKHDKSVADKLAYIAKLQARIDLLALDDSREAQAERAKLEEELAEKQGELAEEQSDYAYDQQVDALDREYEAFEKEKNAEIEYLENLYSSEEKLFQAAIDRIHNGWDTLYQDLLAWNSEYGSDLNKNITSVWNAAADAVARYGSFLDALVGTDSHIDLGPSSPSNGNGSTDAAAAQAADILNQMRANSLAWMVADDQERQNLHNSNEGLAGQWMAATGQMLQYSNGGWYTADGQLLYSISKNEIVQAIVDAMKRNSAAWSTADAPTREYLDRMNLILGERLSNVLGQEVVRKNGVWYIGDKKLYDVYHTGGIAGNAPTLKQNEVLAVLEKGEAVLDERRERSLYKVIDFVQILSDRLGKSINVNALNASVEKISPLPKFIAPGVASSSSESFVFSPSIHVAISHSGNLSDADARRYGSEIADVALSKLSDAFTKRGINSIGNAILKQ